jgi:DNA-binding helix-turn-helix protein
MIGLEIKELLYQQRKTQTWLAKQCGVTKGHISQIISGKSQPSIKLLKRISESLLVNIDSFFKDNVF